MAALALLLFIVLPGFLAVLLVLLAMAGAIAYLQSRQRQRSLREMSEMSHTSLEGVQQRHRAGNLWSKGWSPAGRSKDLDWADPRAASAPTVGDRGVDRRPR